MTPELAKLIRDLRELKENEETDDIETPRRHGIADGLLLRYINNEQVAQAFHAIEKWYE